tara:strand:- start:44 stop:307 length:264 start_codon:yes stop_codon:yes gene_type:complete
MSSEQTRPAAQVHGIVIDAFRELRETWFNAHLRSRAHDREWEDETAGELRERQNTALKKRYDEQTESIIAGDGELPIAPRCAHDMSR